MLIYMTDEEIQQSALATKEIKEKKTDLILKFADINAFPSDAKPASVFMAGSPGAGKTEFSKNLILKLDTKVVRIDPDEIRGEISLYNGKNAYIFQNAISIGVDCLFSYAINNNQNFVLDGTMSNKERSMKNIEMVLSKRGSAEIYYIYQDPIVAWQFTQDRELTEGRKITKDAFIRSYFTAKINAQEIKAKYKDRVFLHLVVKDLKGDIGKINLDISKIDKQLKESYNEEKLRKLLERYE